MEIQDAPQNGRYGGRRFAHWACTLGIALVLGCSVYALCRHKATEAYGQSESSSLGHHAAHYSLTEVLVAHNKFLVAPVHGMGVPPKFRTPQTVVSAMASTPVSRSTLSALPRSSVHMSASQLEPQLQAAANAFADAVCVLHTPAVAAREQQVRLRKGGGGSPHVAIPARKCDGPIVLPETTVPSATGTGTPTVYLVGVGPGDIDLLTIKALRLMQSADLVLYDRLITPEVIELIRPEASMLYVGKEAEYAGHGNVRRQHQINSFLLHFVSSGKTVVRLKGGDPTVFGRGGEEVEYLQQHGVLVNVVPGITAAAGVAANLNIPLTHRDHASSVRFITGHARAECTNPLRERYPWEQLADPNTTLVIYMGLKTLPDLVDGLLEAGLPADTPAVAVQDGTTPTQRVVAALLVTLPAAVKKAKLRSPTLVLIGQVVSLLDADRDSATAAISKAAAFALKEERISTGSIVERTNLVSSCKIVPLKSYAKSELVI